MQITPSLLSLFATGLLILYIVVILFSNTNDFNSLTYVNKITLLALLCIAIGIHGLIHLGVEVNYKYNPLKLLY